MMNGRRKDSLKPSRGLIRAEVTNEVSGEIEKVVEVENFVTDLGVIALATNIVEPSQSKVINALSWGDGSTNLIPTPSITSLYRERGTVPIKAKIIERTEEPSLTMLFSIEGNGLSSGQTIIINEIGLRTADGGLFSYRQLTGDETLLLERGKKINVTWKYTW
jgi:hypothetical protein